MSLMVFYLACKGFSFVVCFGLFVFLMLDVWVKFNTEMTTMGVRFEDQKEEHKFLPCLTFCPLNGFKSRQFNYENETFTKETFSEEEIFSDVNLTSFRNRSLFYIEEIKGVFIGRCYMVCYLRQRPEVDAINIPLRKQNDLIG